MYNDSRVEALTAGATLESLYGSGHFLTVTYVGDPQFSKAPGLIAVILRLDKSKLILTAVSQLVWGQVPVRTRGPPAHTPATHAVNRFRGRDQPCMTRRTGGCISKELPESGPDHVQH
jgi:hypothetical protein